MVTFETFEIRFNLFFNKVSIGILFVDWVVPSRMLNLFYSSQYGRRELIITIELLLIFFKRDSKNDSLHGVFS